MECKHGGEARGGSVNRPEIFFRQRELTLMRGEPSELEAAFLIVADGLTRVIFKAHVAG